MVRSFDMDVLASEHNFDEDGYLAGNPDVAAAVASGDLLSGRAHFELFGVVEGRMLRLQNIDDLRQSKVCRFQHFLRTDLPRSCSGGKFNYLSDELRSETKISDTDAVSSNQYDGYGLALIEEFQDGLVLDCGAGKRPVYYENVVNFEIVDYDTTDVVGVGEALPFVDNAFDAVISVAVLEHVRDPFRCAREIARVLKPGGKLYCAVPFLQPEHGYPHHYYNMAPQGLRALFEDMLSIDDHQVPDSALPVWTMIWFLNSWAAGLEGEVKRQFESMTLGEIIARKPLDLIDQPWVRMLSREKNFELACATCIQAHKIV